LGLTLFGCGPARAAAPQRVADIPVGYLQKFFEETVKGGGGIGWRALLFVRGFFVQVKLCAFHSPL
jgi:hypothetical protein